MKKRFFSSMLLLAMIVTTVGMFVSCKDYDDDITDLRNQISSNATDLQSLVNEKITNVTAQITTLQSQATALESAYQTADANLKATLELEIAALQSEADNATTTADAAYAAIQQAQAQIASLQGAMDLVNSAIDALQTALDTANETIASQGTTIDGLLAADATLTEGLIAAQTRADDAYTLAQQAYDLASTKADQADLDALSTTVETLYQNSVDLDNMITMVGSYAFEAYMMADANTSDIEGLQSQLNSLSESDSIAIAAINGSITELEAKIETNQADIATQQAAIDAIKAQVAANAETAKAYTDAVALAAAKDLAEAVEGINASIEEVQNAYEESYEALKGDITSLRTEIETVQSTLESKIATLQSQIENAVTQEELNTEIAKLQAAIDAITSTKDFTDLINQVKEDSITVAGFQGEIQKINQYLANANKRLKGLVFAPTTYVDGIEAIIFTTLQYQAWDDSKLEADDPTGEMMINDDTNHVEEYLVNPKNIDLGDIESFSYISNSATNTFTRSVSEDAPITVVEGSQTLDNGVLSLKLQKKDSSKSLGDDGENFTIVALKAVLSDNVKTDEEKDEEVAIYSDWARLFEVVKTPQIHNTLVDDGSGKLNENVETSHFYKYSKIYGNGGATYETALDSATNVGECIVMSKSYKESIDLDTIVTVCDGEGKQYSLDEYGLEFEFNIMDYYIDNSGVDTINHADYAALDGTILSSKVNEGADARDAINKTPVIQVILKDTKNNAIVDVKYLKIQWLTNNLVEHAIYSPIAELVDDYDCGGSYNDTIWLTDELKHALYQKVIDFWEGDLTITEDEFYDTYVLGSGLYKNSSDAASSNAQAISEYGTLEYQDTIIVWSGGAYDEVSTTEYENGVKNVEVWGYFENTEYKDRLLFNIKLTLNVEPLSTISKDPNLWDNSGARNINQQLYEDDTYGHNSYSTTQYLGSLVNGYMKNTVTPTAIDGVIVGHNYTLGTGNFVFDEDKLGEIAEATGTKASDWTVSDDGLTLYYKYKKDDATTIAATIVGNTQGLNPNESIIQLAESNPGQAGSVATEGAKLLIGNYVPIKLVAQYCSMENYLVLDNFNVKFLTPLSIDLQTSDPTYVVDITNGGSSTESIENTIHIEELVNNPYIVFTNYDGETPKTGLAAWYDLEVTFDEANAMCNIIDDGYSEKCETKLSDVKKNGVQKYNIDIDDVNWTVTYYNLSGEAVGHEFTIEVPIKITSKWQDYDYDDYDDSVLTVVIKPSSSVNSESDSN